MSADDSELKRLSYTFHDEIIDETGKKISTWDGLRNLPLDTNLIQYVKDTITAEVAEDKKLVGQVLIIALSAYTPKPMHLEISAPTGEGKSYPTHKTLSLFPKEDVVFVVAQSNKAFFHEKGIDVIVQPNGDIITYKEAVNQIKIRMKDAQERLSKETEENNKRPIENELRELDDMIDELDKKKSKLIDNSGKIVFLQDTPQAEIMTHIMSILSQDKYETEYRYVEAHGRGSLTTKVNILSGFSSVILCQAIDTSANPRAEEIARRLVHVNPEMSPKKYSAAMKLAALRYGEPNDVYENEVVSTRRKELAKQAIRYIKHKIRDITKDFPRDGNVSNVKIPYKELILDSFPQTGANEMTVFPRMLNVIGASTLINYDKRPKILTPYGIVPIAILDDLQVAIDLLQDSVAGVRPYILQWYNEVFLKAYEDQDGRVKSLTRDGKTIYEKVVGVTIEELAAKTKEVMHKDLGDKYLREKYIYYLVNSNLINKHVSEIHKNFRIYSPVEAVEVSSGEEPNFREKALVFYKNKFNPRNFTSKEVQSCVKSNIQAYLQEALQKGEAKNLYDHNDKLIDLNTFHDTYFSNLGDFFVLHDTFSPPVSTALLDPKGNITRESQQMAENDIKSIQKVDETPNSSAFFEKTGASPHDVSTIEHSSTNEHASEVKTCVYCNQTMNPTEYMDHVIETHTGFSLFPTPEELNVYKATHFKT